MISGTSLANQTGLSTFKGNRSNPCLLTLAAVTINPASFDFGVTNDVIFKRVYGSSTTYAVESVIDKRYIFDE
jgi:hypothetical protein